MMLEGAEMFLVILFATGTMALSSSGGGHGASGGFNLQAIRLLLLELLIILSFFISSETPKWGAGTIAYMVYILWITYTLTYAPSFNYGFRYVLKYVFPLLMMLGASAIVRDEKVFLAICVWARRIALISTLVVLLPFLRRFFTGIFWYETALQIHYVVISAVSLALYFFYGKDKKDLLLAIYFVIPCVVEVHRTGLLAMFAGLAVFCFLKWKWISLPYILSVLAIGIAIVFYVPSFHEKMFWKEGEKGQELTIQDLREGNITEDDIRNNGREATWEMLESLFYEGQEAKGNGIGSCQQYLYEHPGVKQTHGDYVQMRCDTGNIGMWLYIIVAIMVFLDCTFTCFNPDVPNYIKACAIIAASSVVGHYAGMYSENVVTYTMATTGYSFGFYGIYLGLKSKWSAPKKQYKANSL